MSHGRRAAITRDRAPRIASWAMGFVSRGAKTAGASPLEERQEMKRGATGLALLAALLLLQGCPSGNELGGVWHPVLPTSGKLIHDPVTGDASVGVELVLGHFGPDVAGVMRFYRTLDYDLTRDGTAPDFECACLYLHKGRYGANFSSFEFVTQGCLPGVSTHESLALRGSFKLDADARLVGELRVIDPDSPYDGQKEALVFTRVATTGSILSSDFTCGHTDDADAGNIYSGR